MGSLYKRVHIFWIKYYRGCKTYRESSKTDNEKKAREILKLREAQVKTGTFSGLRVDR